MTAGEEANILSNFLVYLHTTTWMGNHKDFKKCMNAVAAYSYCRTNGNEGDEYPKECELRTLLALRDIHIETVEVVSPPQDIDADFDQ